MKNLRDVSQVSILGRQLYPRKSKGFLQAYEDVLNSEKYGYFVVDMCPHAEDRYRQGTRIFPQEDPIIYRLTQERAREPVRVTMVQLIIQERHFLLFFVQTTPSQRKALLQTITRQQLRALSQIAHNIVKFKIQLTATEKRTLKRERRPLHMLGDRTLGYWQKTKAICDKQ